MGNNYYSVEQISSMLKIHPKTIQRYIREGKLHASKIGKSWRITGHDLSTFIENDSPAGSAPENRPARQATASSVIDINVGHHDEAIRLMNTLTAALNAKPPEYGQSSLQVQYIEQEQMVRITLWGSIRFMAVMMDTISVLSEGDDEEHESVL